MRYDYVVVGAGLTGAVIARLLTDSGKSVVVLERRSHVGGNVADAVGLGGIRHHLHGPHLFRTSSRSIWRFVNRFAAFYPYRHRILTRVDGRLENWPIAASCIRRLCGDRWRPARRSNAPPANFEQAALSLMPRAIYEKFVKGYTEKQWGKPARLLSPALCTRFEVRDDDNPYLHPRHKYQGLPREGYSRMIERMLQGIRVVLGFDYLADRDLFRPRRMLVFTGPIDQYFGFALGRLAYRGQHRDETFHADSEYVQPCAQVNEPGPPPHVRDIEWKHLLPAEDARGIRGTLVTRETPFSPGDPDQYEYPMPDEHNMQLFNQYRALAAREAAVSICGRLGEYRYLDMDHAISRAMEIARRILAGHPLLAVS